MKNLTEIRDEALEKIAACADNNALNQLRILYLGKKGPIQEVMKTMKDLLKEERPAFGAQINEIKRETSVQIEERHAILETKEMNEAMEQEKLDITLSGYHPQSANMPPLMLLQLESEDVFIGLGYQAAKGP